jgi:hypothetical protein
MNEQILEKRTSARLEHFKIGDPSITSDGISKNPQSSCAVMRPKTTINNQTSEAIGPKQQSTAISNECFCTLWQIINITSDSLNEHTNRLITAGTISLCQKFENNAEYGHAFPPTRPLPQPATRIANRGDATECLVPDRGGSRDTTTTSRVTTPLLLCSHGDHYYNHVQPGLQPFEIIVIDSVQLVPRIQRAGAQTRNTIINDNDDI